MTDKPPTTSIWRLSRPLWLLILAFSIFVEFAASFATNGRVHGWRDILFIITFAALSLISLTNAVRRP